jgi:hypothetical protein
MARADPLFKLRLPDRLRNDLEKEAAKSGRSLTAEILDRLEMSFSDIVERLSSLEKEVFDGKRGNEALSDRITVFETIQRGHDPYNRPD